MVLKIVMVKLVMTLDENTTVSSHVDKAIASDDGGSVGTDCGVP